MIINNNNGEINQHNLTKKSTCKSDLNLISLLKQIYKQAGHLKY